MKQLISSGVWEYPYTAQGLQEAQVDAHYAANDMGKSRFHRYKSTRHVLTDRLKRGYFGPIGDYWKTDIVWRDCVLVYTAEPTEGE